MRKLLIIVSIVLFSCEGYKQSDMYSGGWKSTDGKDFDVLMGVLARNNPGGCGEFYYKKNKKIEGEYLVACTSDNINWNYYYVFPDLDQVNVCSDEVIHP